MVECGYEHGKRQDLVPNQTTKPSTVRKRIGRKQHPELTRTRGPVLLVKKVKKMKCSFTAKHLFLSSWKERTRRQYAVYLKRWSKFCVKVGEDPEKFNVDLVADFLAYLFREGYAYGSINVARSALSSILSNDRGSIGSNPVIVRVMRGIQILRPQLAEYQSTWDVNIVFSYLQSLTPLRKLTLKKLTVKTLLLMLLTSCQRLQTVHVLKVSDLLDSTAEGKIVFRLSESLKHHRKGSLGLLPFL